MNNILAGNLGRNLTEHDIRALFENHGAVQRFKLTWACFVALALYVNPAAR